MSVLTKRTYVTALLLLMAIVAAPAAGATTNLTIVRYAADGSTILNETTVDYLWMEAHLPVLGDGVTHYYHQGPTFEPDDLWNPDEDINVLDKDQGAVNGTDLADLCNLVGGMSEGETVKVKASDGFSKVFPYDNVYRPDPRQGPIGVTWYKADEGYVTDYADGMKIVFFADNSTNPWEYNVFGVSDMQACLDKDYWHFFYDGSIFYPTTTGLAVKYVSTLEIYSNEDAPPGGDPLDVLFNDTLTLADESFSCTAGSTPYTVNRLTPIGALDATGLDYVLNDKSYEEKGILLLDGIEDYPYNKSAGTTWTWICAVNGYTLDDFNNYTTEGFNVYTLEDGDIVEFYYGVKPITPENATAYVRIAVEVEEPSSDDWTLALKGKLEETVHRTYFEAGVNCGHNATYTDDRGTWSGMPLWWLVGYVDDEENHGSGAFNDELAEQGYSVKITAGDGYSINFPSAAVARNDDIIVANMLNGEPLPATIGDSDKPCWPLQLVGSDVSSGQKIGNIVEIELVGLPEPPTGWTITLAGAFNRTITQEEFEAGIDCGHSASYTDGDSRVWTGMPLWYLLAVVDDINEDSHWTFNDTRAADGYTITITAEDGFSRMFASADVARSDGYIVANRMNAAPLSPDDGYPLKLQGANLTSGGQRVGKIASITIAGLPEEPAPGEWTLTLVGPKITAVISQSAFEEAAACHGATYDDGVSTWTGVPLWYLAGWVDDDIMHGSSGFNNYLAEDGYTVIVSSGGDSPYSKEFTSQEMIENKNHYIVANQVNGSAIEGSAFPLRLVGEGATGSKSVGNIETIELTAFQAPTEPPSVQIVRYASDGVTVVNETTKDYLWMMDNLHVYGGEEGVRLRFQGPTMDPDDLWNPAEDKNPGKVDEVVRGTSIKDLCDLVGGAPEGAEIVLVASDGYRMTMNYTNLYTPLDRQGEAILAWWTERQGYVPDYTDGYRLFFNAPDGIFGADDMRASLAEEYWHYWWGDGVQYPSAAGVSNKNIVTIEIYTGARDDWTLLLTGAITDTIARAYFESGKACAMAGSSHHAIYTDDQGTWSGMPLWTLVGWVDDDNRHDYGSDPFRDDLAAAGYNVTVIDYGPDGIKGTDDDFSATFNSTFVARNQNIIVADELNGQPLPQDGDKPPWPLRLVGSALTSGKQRVGSIDEIELTDLPVEADAAIILEEGWNFVSVPRRLAPGQDTAMIFDAVDTADHSVWEYDAALLTWKAISPDDGIVPLKACWIYAAAATEVPLYFCTDPLQTPPTRDLECGWNAVGFTDTGPATARDTFLSLGDAWTQAIGYDAETQEYAASIIRGGSDSHSDDRDMLPMQGYWVYLRECSTIAAISA